MCYAGKINWVFFVKNMLYKHGFAFLNQGVCDKKQFISLFKQRLKDNHLLNNNIYRGDSDSQGTAIRQFLLYLI